MRDSEESLKLIVSAMTRAGIDAEDVLRRLARAGHVPAFDGRFDHAMHVAFWRVVEEVTGDAEIGLHLCPHLPVYRGRVFEYLFLSSANYEAGLRTAFQYQRLVGDAFHVDLVVDARGPRVVMSGAAGDAPELRHTETCTVYAWLRAMAVATSGRFVPERVRLWGQPNAAKKEYERIFGRPVEFTETQNEVWLAPELLRYRSPHGDPDLLQLHTKYADNQLARLACRDLMDDVYEHVKRKLRAGAHDGIPADLALPDVAREFGISARHLRFVLSETGTTFRRMLAEARFTLASRMLRKTSDPIEDIASRLGFSEPSTFHRAFKKWSGMTPARFRERKAGKA